MPGAWSLARTVSGEFFSELHRSNVLLAARAKRHLAKGFRGPLSVKGVASGEATWNAAGQTFTVDSTSCLVVEHGEPYDMVVDSLDEVQTFVVFFSDEIAAGVAEAMTTSIDQLIESEGAPGSGRIPVSKRLWLEGEPIHTALHALRECALAPVEQGEVDRYLRRVLEALMSAEEQGSAERRRIDAAKATTRAELYERVLRGKAFLDASIDAPFDLGAVARAARMAPHHFHRTFRSVFGRTPFGYVTEGRVRRARRLLIEHDWDVVEVCAAVGYESVSSFTRLFKRETGRTPAAFRHEHRLE
ncbi:MAG: AraC family transcriptional regulator [Vicinamibacteria bacterium]|nr:AraC family transcriptional regulator [Vicinamibacteria bacterium]